MNQAEQALLIEKVAEDVVESFKPRIREFEREGDRLIGEVNTLQRRLAAERRNVETLRVAVAQRQEAYERLDQERQRDQRAMLELSASAQRWAEATVNQDVLIAALRQEKQDLLGSLATTERLAAGADRLAGQRAEELRQALETVQEREQQLIVMQATLQDARQRYVLAEKVYDDIHRPKAHDHSTEEGAPPVIVLDLHGTMTPSPAFVAYGQPGFMEPPFDGVKDALDLWASQGICHHIATAGLDPNQNDPLVRAVRKVLIEAWYTTYGIPISWVTGNVKARAYYDDRMVVVYAGNWEPVRRGVESQLNERAELLPNGFRKLIALPEQGELIEDWPDPADVPPDRPRGLSTRILDVDVHRCLVSSNSSTRVGRIRPGAAEVLQDVYGRGYGIHLSCAGWDPLTHTPEESAQRLGGMKLQAVSGHIPFDQFVAKDHGTVFVNDKGIAYRDWKRDQPLILRMLGSVAPDDEASVEGSPA